jgi:tRNA A-37 threonylcarbamoyl transferase component Bud32
LNIRWIDLSNSLANELADLPTLVGQGRATVVKERPQRCVYRIHIAGQDLHVKQCKVRGWRAWLRDRFRAPKARLEYAKLLAAIARQVPTIQPLGYGVASDQSFLVTPTVGGALPLDQFLERPHLPTEGFALAEALGRFMARIHTAGVHHPDPHPGNILIRDAELFLLDLHDARLGAPLGERASIANLVLLNRWFILRANRAARLRFWRAYVAERKLLDYFHANEVERRTWQSNLRFWRGRAKRCVGENRRFRRVSFGNISGFAARDSADDALLRDPEALFTGTTILKDSHSSAVSVSGAILCKHFRRSSRACRRAWINGHAFLDCLLPTPRPLAMACRYRFGMPRDGFLLTEFIPDAINLRDAVTDDLKRCERIDHVARLIRHLHQRGWSHRDLKAANILLAPNSGGRESAWIIDLAGASRPIRLSRDRRAKDLARLNASFHDLPLLSRTDRLRFLRLYLNWNLHGRGDWKSWWKCVDAHTRRKVAKNRRRGRPLA